MSCSPLGGVKCGFFSSGVVEGGTPLQCQDFLGMSADIHVLFAHRMANNKLSETPRNVHVR